MLILTRRVGETIRVGDYALVVIAEVAGSQVRIGIRAPRPGAAHVGCVPASVIGQARPKRFVHLPPEEQRVPSLPLNQPASSKRGNQLLDQLPEDVYARLASGLREVELKTDTVLFAPHAPHARLYFPSSGIVSVQHDMADGAGGSVAMIGNEGMVGMALLLHTQGASTRAVVLMQGHAFCLEDETFKREFRRGNAFQQVLLHYVQARIAEMSQVAICNRYHSIEKQLCRWLLLCVARRRTEEIRITQEAIARMLGVRREGVTIAARNLQQVGLIRYRHSHIQVIDPVGLELRSCECYRAIVAEYARAMGRPLSA